MAKTHSSAKPTETALNRLQRDAPDGPPFIGVMLDEPTLRCLDMGVINARAEVAFRRAVANLDAVKAI